VNKPAGQLQRLAIAPEQLQGQSIYLNAEQQHYLYDVLRLGHGDRFIAMNGQGQLWLAELLTHPAQAMMLHSLQEQTELAMPVMVLAAPPKGNHFDQVVRSSTELGVSHIVPLISQRTLLHPSPHKIQRWRRIATEAAEQSRRQLIPQVFDPITFTEVIAESDLLNSHPWQKYICQIDPTATSFLKCLSTSMNTGIAVMVGPEGGWTDTEKNQAQSAGYQAVSLGRRTLRSVTATCMAVSVAIAQLELQTVQQGGLV